MYILKVNILLNLNDEDCSFENKITDAIERLIIDEKAILISTNTDKIIGNNYGKCEKCGCWVSDYNNEDFIPEFSNGCKYENRWLCDLCLPSDHPQAF